VDSTETGEHTISLEGAVPAFQNRTGAMNLASATTSYRILLFRLPFGHSVLLSPMQYRLRFLNHLPSSIDKLVNRAKLAWHSPQISASETPGGSGAGKPDWVHLPGCICRGAVPRDIDFQLSKPPPPPDDRHDDPKSTNKLSSSLSDKPTSSLLPWNRSHHCPCR